MDHQSKHRTNINLFANDVEWLRRRFGYGWTEKVRDIVHDYIKNREIRESILEKLEQENPKDFP